MARTGDPSPEAEGEEEPEVRSLQLSRPSLPLLTALAPEVASSMPVFMSMQPTPANVMSPNDMLRAYAECRALGGTGSVKGPTVPSPTYASGGAQGGLCTLYSPTRSQKHMTLESQYNGSSSNLLISEPRFVTICTFLSPRR